MAGYNGWNNYETWMIALWMDNSPGDQEFWREVAEDCIGHNPEDQDDQLYDLSKRLEDHWRESIPESVEGVWLDCINSTLSEVDWREIAEHILDDVREEVVAEND